MPQTVWVLIDGYDNSVFVYSTEELAYQKALKIIKDSEVFNDEGGWRNPTKGLTRPEKVQSEEDIEGVRKVLEVFNEHVGDEGIEIYCRLIDYDI